VSADILLPALVRWLDLVAFAALAGAAGLALAVVPPDAPELDGVRRALGRICAAATAALLATSAAELVLRAHTMAGGGLETALAAMPSVLARTHFGHLWTLRATALALLLLLSGSARPAARWATVLPILAVGAATSLTGHAADHGDLSLAALADCLHVLASAVWTGGLLCLAGLARSRTGRPARVPALARRFSRLAGLCLLAVAVSGAFNAWVELPSVSALWTTAYGRVLAVKVAFVLALAGLGAENRFRIVPALSAARGNLPARWFDAVRRRMGAGAVDAERGFWRLVAREALLVLAVLGCTAVLVQLAPPRHQHHPVSSARYERRIANAAASESAASPPPAAKALAKAPAWFEPP